ncbi:hypothetical protein RM553_08390 [Zunongwangia sp. F363]|uniref:SGNH hydrolase-type esterase domain-containing protein n=1 Tax=Autumnicola tepida TaxID=3075595 RepID=A0ABU3C926_9FLAO|nr:hypothetical protein [Zunongwangia sp. F363]MDT0642846.1 hypothetical protein [Zunongwangia sp. F363]
MLKFIARCLIFILPVLLVYTLVEYNLRQLPYGVKVKNEFAMANREKIKILALGSSHFERGINPEYMDSLTLNLGNSSQRIVENYRLLLKFEPLLPNLKLVIVELSFDWLERNKSRTSPVIDNLNLIFYNVNTFERDIKPQDYLLFPSNPDYFSNRLREHLFNESAIKFNRYGFDTNRFYGSYEAVQHRDSLIRDEDIFVENADDPEAFSRNVKVLQQFIDYCKKRGLKVLIYSTPTHYRYNQLRDNKIVARRDSILEVMQNTYPNLNIYIDEENPEFITPYFYNGDHLNPNGAEKATKLLNTYIEENIFRK